MAPRFEGTIVIAATREQPLKVENQATICAKDLGDTGVPENPKLLDASPCTRKLSVESRAYGCLSGWHGYFLCIKKAPPASRRGFLGCPQGEAKANKVPGPACAIWTLSA